MSKILITGVSSGIGRALTKKLVTEKFSVWGIARRENLLQELKKELNSARFIYSAIDLSESDSWNKIIIEMKNKKFIPDAVIFNAAISLNDIFPKIDPSLTRKIFDINFFSIIEGIAKLLGYVKQNTTFIAISSLSAFKGSSLEGMGYPSSKAALSIAFESLHQGLKDKYHFKTVYFGPIASGMGPFEKKLPIILSENQAIKVVISAIKEEKMVYYAPRTIFWILKSIKLMPSNIYFMVLSIIENLHTRIKKRKVNVD